MTDAVLDLAVSRVLVLNGASAGAAAGSSGLVAALDGDVVVAERSVPGRGAAENFAVLTRDVLEAACWRAGPQAIVAVVGPGSFTGIRASLSLAAGLSAGFGCPAYGVTSGAALRGMPGADAAACVIMARRNRCFVDDGTQPPYAAAPASIVLPDTVQALIGDGVALMPDPALPQLAITAPTALAILCAARKSVVPLRPLYIDPPEASPPQGGLRPAPVG